MKRVRLTWDRNQDPDTKAYRIYRSEKPNINEQNREDFLIMRVDHPVEVNPVKVENEVLHRYSSRTYLIDHDNILLEWKDQRYPFIIHVNDVPVTNFTLDVTEGVIVFDDGLAETDKVVAIEYTFDGMQAWDYAVDEDGKIYHGPDAKDVSSPSIPQNVQMSPDYERNRIVIDWNSSSPIGKRFYYRIDAMSSLSHYSGLSQWRVANIQEDLADRPYLVEKSLDGVAWNQVARIKQNRFYEYMIDRKAPEGVTGLKANTYLYPSGSDAQVSLSWDPVYDSVTGKTALYRVRAVNRVGAVSEPSNIVGPIPFQVQLDHILIRRKENDGTLPTYDGNDSITVGKVDASKSNFVEDVEDNKVYIYGVWVVDKAGNHSPMHYIIVNVGDNTPPSPVLNLSGSEFKIFIG